jgi:hypothetical protein
MTSVLEEAHLNGCRGQPHVSDQEIIKRLDRVIAKKRKKFPNARPFHTASYS